MEAPSFPPTDALSIDDFYKVQGCACIYKSQGKTVDAIPIEDLAVSIFRHVRPRKMLAALKRMGFEVEAPHPGIYQVRGPLCVPAQVVVTSELEGYESFKILAKGAKREDVEKFLAGAYGARSEHVSAILRVSMAANRGLYQELREGSPMVDVFESIFHKKELAEKEAKGRAEGRTDIISRMLGRGMTPEQVADVTALPLEEVLSLLGRA